MRECVYGLPGAGEAALKGLGRANTCWIWVVSSSGGVVSPGDTLYRRNTRLSPVFRMTQPAGNNNSVGKLVSSPSPMVRLPTWYLEAEGGGERWEGRKEVILEVEGDAASRSGVFRVGLERGGEHRHIARPAVVCPQLSVKHGTPVKLWGRLATSTNLQPTTTRQLSSGVWHTNRCSSLTTRSPRNNSPRHT